MKIDPISLRLFVAAMEEKTIAAAAARQCIAASAASRRLAELEQQLDVTLFTRSNKGMAPAPAAYALLNLARTVLNDLDSIGAQMLSWGSGMLGQVRVAANISAITQFLPADLKSFLTHYPGVQIQLDEQISSQVAQSVLSNTADLGILNEGQYGDGLQFISYREDELVLVTPQGHPLTEQASVRMTDALPYDFVGAHLGSAINNQLIVAAALAKAPLRMRIHVTSFDAMCLMVSAGLGIGVLPAGSARLYTRALGLTTRPLAEPWARRRLVIAVRGDASRSSATQLLIRHLTGAA
ncbi:LysR family transcriptional regulator [Corticibacter populi]|uniref:LysR family transcriptional regulator n=1 Tax=Corticibacter populi TaxID=1550736 RepID=A0A3M6QUE4_9BURK|nr:LysR substrate-binding domain-containing protein [Corticibacter populi]RMX06648.1 LysR family transcriptional regulator [Corticibacter populi]RZS31780.1 DNA-binding transcriptional LysR family regulator [Corticibacter populi]